MRKERPLILSIVLSYFFVVYVIPDLATVLMAAVEVVEDFGRGGIGKMYSSYKAKIKPPIYHSLAEGIVYLIILSGLWGMRRWGLYGFSALVLYMLWLLVSEGSLSVVSYAILAGSLAIAWYSFYKPAKKVELPPTHQYTGKVVRSDHEPKSAIEDLIY